MEIVFFPHQVAVEVWLKHDRGLELRDLIVVVRVKKLCHVEGGSAVDAPGHGKHALVSGGQVAVARRDGAEVFGPGWERMGRIKNIGIFSRKYKIRIAACFHVKLRIGRERWVGQRKEWLSSSLRIFWSSFSIIVSSES